LDSATSAERSAQACTDPSPLANVEAAAKPLSDRPRNSRRFMDPPSQKVSASSTWRLMRVSSLKHSNSHEHEAAGEAFKDWGKAQPKKVQLC